MQRFAILIPILALGACGTGPSVESPRIDDWLNRSFEHKLISSGDNFPTVNLRREHRADVALLLHAGFEPDSIAAYFDWSPAELQDRVDALTGAGLLDSTRLVPTFPILTVDEVARHMSVPPALVDESVALIASRLQTVRDLVANAPGLGRLSFEDVSFLVLSDVVLDNWQINAVERDFVGAERPLRDGKRYYFALQEDIQGDSTEAFGIYGNQYRGFGPFTVGVYGNRRTNNPLNFATLDADDLERLFGERPDTVAAFKRRLLSHLVRAWESTEYEMPSAYRAGFEAIGWMAGSQVVVPVLAAEDEDALDRIAESFTDDLVALLERHRDDLARQYRGSPYAEGVSFEEYLIWWYHLYYTAVTDRMAEQGLLRIPESGITSYVLAVGS